MDLIDWLSGPEAVSLVMIIVIDVVMSGDNAIVIGMAVASLPVAMRHRAIVIGVMGATVLRVAFALVAVQLLGIVGLTLAGGLLLLWVCYRMWREIVEGQKARQIRTDAQHTDGAKPVKTLGRALVVIIVADVSMSLDNVLAVAGAARGHEAMLIFGLALSIFLMAVASNYIAKLLERRIWIAYVGLAVISFVAVEMIWRGTAEVGDAFQRVGWIGF